MPGTQVVHSGACAFVRHVHQLDTRAAFQQLDGQVAHGAVAGKSDPHWLGLFLGCGHQVGQGLVGRVRLDRHHHGLRRHQGDGHQVFQRVKRHLGVQRRVDRHVGGLANAEGVAVGHGAGHGVQANVASGTGAVFHHDGPAGGGGDLFGHQAAQKVGAAAGWERHHQTDRALRPAVGVFLCPRGAGERGEGSGGCHCDEGAAMDHGFVSWLSGCWMGVTGRILESAKHSVYWIIFIESLLLAMNEPQPA